jgi:trans-aconitate methyltransferase
MSECHKYFFNTDNRLLVGEFEKMYQQEKILNFDSWHQDNSNQLNRRIALNILSNYNFERIVHIGVGKGVHTHQLKKLNNHVLGLDVSPTAIEVVNSRFPDIEFKVVDVNDLLRLTSHLDNKYNHTVAGGAIDLVFTAECLCWIEIGGG